MKVALKTTSGILISMLCMLVVFGAFSQMVFAEPSYTMNYQGKLTDSTGLAVANGTYQIEFNLYTAPTGGSAIWTETRSGGNEVTVTNGLFSVMLGSVTPLTSVDFNQPLYLGVTVEADAEMTPRKAIGTVPSAFEARQLGGVASSSFLRSDVADTASGLLSFTGGFISSASSTIAGLTTGTATTTRLVIGTDSFTDLTGTGLTNTGGVLTVATSTLGLSAAFSNSAELAALLSDETGTGNVVFSASPTFTGTSDFVAGDFSSTLTMSGTAANIALGSNYISSNGGDYGISVNSSGHTTISGVNGSIMDTFKLVNTSTNTASGNALSFLSGTNDVYAQITEERISSGNGDLYFSTRRSGTVTEALRLTAAGNVGIGTTSPYAKLSVAGNLALTGGIYDNGASLGSNGMVLLSTGTGVDWVATSSLGIGGSIAADSLNFTDFADALTLDNNTSIELNTDTFAIEDTTVGYGISWTGSGISIGSQNFSLNDTSLDFTSSGQINLGADGVRITDDGDGAITFLGQGNGNDENLTLNLDDTANTGVFTSTTGLNILNFSSIGLQESGSNVISVGDLDTCAEFAALGALETGTCGSVVLSTSPTITTPTFTTSATVPLIIGGSATSQQLILRSSSGNATTDDIIMQIGNNGATQAFRIDNQNNSIAFGENAGLAFSATVENNVALGTDAGRAANTDNTNFIGEGSGYNSSGSNNNFFGASSGYNNTGNHNNFLGEASGYGNTGWHNNMFGYQPGYFNTGSYNNIFGESAGLINTGWYNNLLGAQSGYINTGSYNEMIGYQAGRYLQSTSTVAFGGQALYGSHATTYISLNNVAVGYRAGYASNDGSGNNILIGYQAADNLTTGNNNIIIGYDIDNISATADNVLNIGNLIFGTGIDGTGTTLASGNIGIGTTSPYAKLSVAGDLALTGGIYDNGASLGSNGMVLLSTGTGVDWVATSSLGISGSSFSNSAQLAALLSDETGTGNAVFSASPTFTGTPVTANLRITGGLFDNSNSDGSIGNILISTGSGVSWSSTADSLDFSEFADNMALDAATEIDAFGSDLTIIDSLGGGYGISIGGGYTDITSTNYSLVDGSGLIISSGRIGAAYDNSLFPAAAFFNDGNNTNRVALELQGGLDNIASAGPSTLISLKDGDGGAVGTIGFGGGAFLINSGSNVLSLNGVITATPGVSIDIEDYTYFNDTVEITGAFVDGSASAGTNGMILQTTGTGVQWVATSSLGISGGGSLFTDGGANTYLTATGDNLSIGGTGGSAKLNVYGNIDIAQAASGLSFMGTRYFYASTTNDSIAIGENAGATFTSGTTYSVALGFNAGRYASTSISDFNNYIGFNAGYSSVGSDNNSIGSNAGENNVGGGNNFIGAGAGFDNAGSDNNFLGFLAGGESSGSRNNFFGYNTGYNNTGNQNNFLGSYAGQTVTRNSVIAIGAEAGRYASTSLAASSTYIGYQAGYYNTQEFSNIIGYQAGYVNQGAVVNLIGRAAGAENTGTYTNIIGDTAGAYNTGDRTNIMGDSAGLSNTGSSSNIFGLQAGQNNTGDRVNIFGQYAGLNNIGSDSNLIGTEAGWGNDGNYVNAIGYFSGTLNTANENNFFGSYAGHSNTGLQNNLIGSYAGASNSGENNNITGYYAGRYNTGDFNNITGYYAGHNNTGDNNILTGYYAGADMVATSSESVFIGYQAGRYANALNSAVSIGYQAGYEASGNSNVFLGRSAGYSMDGGSNFVGGDEAGVYAAGDYANIIGYRAAYNATTTVSFSNIMGYYAGNYSNGQNNNLFGPYAGTNMVGSSNNAFGYGAGDSARGGDNNFFGALAGANTDGGANNFIGYHAGQNADGDYNNYIGYNAGVNLSGNNNTVLGTYAMTGDAGAYTGSTNVAIGYGAGYYATGDANNNVLLGGLAGEALTTGDNNIVIGHDIDLPNNAGNYQLNIGNIIYGTNIDGAGTTLSTGNIGIGTTSPYAKLSVTNTGSGPSFLVEDSTSPDSTPFVIDANGNVGIGRINPLSLLETVNYSSSNGGEIDVVRIAAGNDAANDLAGISFSTRGFKSDRYTKSAIYQVQRTSSDWGRGDLVFAVDSVSDANEVSTADEKVRITYEGKFGIGTTSPNAKLSLQSTGFTGAGVIGTDQWYQSTNSTLNAVQYGNRNYLTFAGTATTTVVGSMFRFADNTTYGNTVRGLEVQTNQGSNPYGENTAISGSGRTFGIRGITSGNAGSVYEPAGGFFQTNGTTQGNAMRGYSSTITSATLLSLFQDTSAFTGTGLEMNFGNSSGSFNNATSKFIDLQNAGTSAFTISAYGTTTIGNGTNYAGLQIGRGGLCVDNDGSCSASVAGRIASVSTFTGNSDLAETYFSSTWLETGEIVTLKGELSIDRAEKGSDMPVLGVVSTKPGLLLGADDTSLTQGERSYPVALRGRVPIKLSNENGPIKKGDPLTLSSIPGVAMKATDGGTIVGTALEDFDESKAYSATYINQFGDDIAEEAFEPIVTNDDPRIHDGCYYGGGAETGKAPCVPLTGVTPDQQVASANQILRDDIIRGLKNKSSVTKTLENGQQVKVGQIVMFVDLNHSWFAKDQMASIASLFATSSVINIGDNQNESLFDRVKNLANNFVDGVLSVFKLKADRIEVKEELCVDGVCINADDLRHMLEQSGTSGHAPSPEPENTVEPEETDDTSDQEQTEETDTSSPDDSSVTPEVTEEPPAPEPEEVEEQSVMPESVVEEPPAPEPNQESSEVTP